MAVTATSTVQDICTDALLDIHVVALDGTAEAHEMQIAVRYLNRMLKSWQGEIEFLEASQTLTLTTAASYTLSPVRPAKIINARLKSNGTETPMISMSRTEYDELPVKASTGIPTQFFYDKQSEAALFYVWPVLASASGETVEITYEREFEDLQVGDTIDLPAEWYEAVVLSLADRLQLPFRRSSPDLAARAREAKSVAQSMDAGASVTFMGA